MFLFAACFSNNLLFEHNFRFSFWVPFVHFQHLCLNVLPRCFVRWWGFGLFLFLCLLLLSLFVAFRFQLLFGKLLWPQLGHNLWRRRSRVSCVFLRSVSRFNGNRFLFIFSLFLRWRWSELSFNSLPVFSSSNFVSSFLYFFFLLLFSLLFLPFLQLSSVLFRSPLSSEYLFFNSSSNTLLASPSNSVLYRFPLLFNRRLWNSWGSPRREVSGFFSPLYCN